jgi:hypothetical protein
MSVARIFVAVLIYSVVLLHDYFLLHGRVAYIRKLLLDRIISHVHARLEYWILYHKR